jgi:hypothetical protein
MNGMIAAGVLWYVMATMIASVLAAWYDGWITRAHKGDGAARVVPTSLLVVAGVAGTEAFRVVRLLPLAILGARAMGLAMAGWLLALVVLAVLVVDSVTAYVATGLPMVRGDLARMAAGAQEAEAVGTARAERVWAMLGGEHDDHGL